MSSESSTFNSSSNNDSNIINSPNSNKRAIQQTLLDLIRTLTKECKHIFHLTEKEDSEISNAYNRALRTSLTVIEIVQFMPSDYQNILVESARLINSTVVELVKASKFVAANPFDYLAKQRLVDSSLFIEESTKSFLAFLDILVGHIIRHENNQPGDKDFHSTPAEILDPHLKKIALTVKKLREVAHAGNEAGVAEYTLYLESTVAKLVGKAKKIEKEEESGEREETKEKHTKRAEALERLRLASMSIISSARLIFTNPQNNAFVAQFDKDASLVSKAVYALGELNDDEYLPF